MIPHTPTSHLSSRGHPFWCPAINANALLIMQTLFKIVLLLNILFSNGLLANFEHWHNYDHKCITLELFKIISFETDDGLMEYSVQYAKSIIGCIWTFDPQTQVRVDAYLFCIWIWTFDPQTQVRLDAYLFCIWIWTFNPQTQVRVDAYLS